MPNGANISEQRIIECIASARLWSIHIKETVDKMHAIADRYTISAALISAITGLAAWGQVTASTRVWAQILVGVMAIAAAVVAVIPRVKGYSESASKLAPLATKYGAVLGGLLDALSEIQMSNPNAQIHAQIAIREFEKVKAEKDLCTLPSGLQTLINQERSEAIAKEATDGRVELRPKKVA